MVAANPNFTQRKRALFTTPVPGQEDRTRSRNRNELNWHSDKTTHVVLGF
jgi:hypothetical protein